MLFNGAVGKANKGVHSALQRSTSRSFLLSILEQLSDTKAPAYFSGRSSARTQATIRTHTDHNQKQLRRDRRETVKNEMNVQPECCMAAPASSEGLEKQTSWVQQKIERD